MQRSRHKIESITLTSMLSGITFILLAPLRLGLFDASIFFLIFFLCGFFLLQYTSLRYLFYYLSCSLTLSFLMVPLLTVISLAISALSSGLSVILVRKKGLTIFSVILLLILLITTTFLSLYVSSLFLNINPLEAYNASLRAFFNDLGQKYSSISYLFTLLSQLSFSLILLIFLINDVLVTALTIVLLLSLGRAFSFKVKYKVRRPLRSLSLLYAILLTASFLFILFIDRIDGFLFLTLSIVLTIYLTFSILLSLIIPITVLQKKRKVEALFLLSFLLAVLLAPLSAILSLTLLYRLRLKLR